MSSRIKGRGVGALPWTTLVTGWIALVPLVGLAGIADPDFQIRRVFFGPDQRVRIEISAEPNSYYTLFRGEAVTRIGSIVDLALGEGRFVELMDSSSISNRPVTFYRVLKTPTERPADSDGDGIDDVYELRRRTFLDPLDPADAQTDFDGDRRPNVQEYQEGTDPATVDIPPLTSISTSPAPGEGNVSVSRETIIRFSNPLASTVAFTTNHLYAQFGGRRLLSRIELASDRKAATLFFLEPLPGSARVRVYFNAADLFDINGKLVDADGDGTPGGAALIEFETVSQSVLLETVVCGRLFASELAVRTNGSTNLSVNVPLGGVIITADGLEEIVRAVSDSFGNLRLTNAPAGAFFVHIDGRNIRDDSKGIRYPDLAYYPFVGKKWTSIAGQEVNIGDIYLPLITTGTLRPVSAIEDTRVTFADKVLQEHPELAGVSITVPANSLFSENGTRGGMVGIAPVPPDRLPEPLPPGLNFPLVITVQTDGPANFDRPVPVCFPNLPDPATGRPRPAGSKTELWSFNHDTGRFEIVGPMTVSADGQFVCSDPGVGIPAPGWHGWADGVLGTGGYLEKLLAVLEELESPNGQPEDATDPVYLFSGEFHTREEDLYIPGRGLHFAWVRSYRSRVDIGSAQGNGWDYSYNVSLAAVGEDLVLRNGQARVDRFRRNPNGTYWRDGFFRELAKEQDGSFTLRFDDKTEWRFRVLDSSPAAGKLSAVVDRNGNTMSLVYDPSGRLARVRDTLDRDIVIEYNPQGWIDRLIDFAGRIVQYEYYDGIQPGGSRGDLKSVRTQVVVGTPHGNDFPNGKMRTYTYTAGFARESLNHNLLTITDGRRNDPADPTHGQGPYLVNVYSDASDRADPLFDRVIRQVWGRDVLDVTYVPLLPSEANGLVVSMAIVNDRIGNVKEYFFDAHNRMVRKREYTGRANPREPTTELSNRPGGKLRPGDPAYFETRYEWNADSLCKRLIYPNGNVSELFYASDFDPSVPAGIRGNLVRIRRLAGTYPVQGDQPVLEESFEYDSRFGGAGFITRHVDARAQVTEHTYDPRGNRVRTAHRIPQIVEEWEYNQFGQTTAYIAPDNGGNHRRRDLFTYYESGPQRGYLQSVVIDSGHENLTTRYEYDLVGNVIRETGPRGFDIQCVRNSLNQIVRQISPEVKPGSGLRYQRDFFYDANNNLIRLDVQNMDERGQLQTNSHLTITSEYEILDRLVGVKHELDGANWLTEEYEYDGNRNRVLVRYGEAVNGNQPANVVRAAYDERDLPFRVTRAPGDPRQSTTQQDYDANGNLTAIRQGIEDAPRVLLMQYDAFNRLLMVVDPMGNVVRTRYDANGNKVALRTEGELVDGSGDSGNVRLSDVTFSYDAMDRLVRTESAFFDTASQAPIGAGSAIGRISYNDRSDVIEMIDANGHSRRYVYDTVGRMQQMIDAKGNVLRYQYDAGNNVVRVAETEHSDLGGDELFVTEFEYDGLDRLVKRIDSAGNVQEYAYDSRDNLTLEIDAQRTESDLSGNTSRSDYDAEDRLIRTTLFQTQDGTGSGNPAPPIVLTQSWDDSNRLRSQTDPQGNTTTYTYDPLNREEETLSADSSRHSVRYDVHHNVVWSQDANGTVLTNLYDALNRLLRREIRAGPGLATNTTFENYAYDGLSRVVRAEDDDAAVLQAFDSFSRVTRETLNGQVTLAQYDPVGNMIACVYPGGRSITTTYDELNRKQTIQDASGIIAAYQYVGPARVQRRDYGNGTRSEFRYDGVRDSPKAPGDFGVKNIVRTTQSKMSGGVVFDQRSYAWDRMGNKTLRRDERAGGLEQQFRYDSLYRLTRSLKKVATQPDQTTEYVHDGAGNRRIVTGGPDQGSYALSSAAPASADASLNQYTQTPFDSRSYDSKGNLSRVEVQGVGRREMVFDYRDRLVEHRDQASGARAVYVYDPLGRRIGKVLQAAIPETTRYFYSGWQVCEEQDAAGATVATYTYGNYVDEVLAMRRHGADYFYHTDDQFNVTSLTDRNGELVEQYEYEDYGQAQIMDAAGFPRIRSAVANPYLFNGRPWDPETGFYYYRTRYLDPRTGRFISRDPLGAFGDLMNLGNSYSYAGNNPWTYLDPFGEQTGTFLDKSPIRPWEWTFSDVKEGAKGSLNACTIVADTFTFEQLESLHQKAVELEADPIYASTRFLSTISREALISALTAGAGAARGGACALQGMGKLAPIVRAIQASPKARQIADLVFKTMEAINAGRDAYDLIAQIEKMSQGNGSVFQAALDLIGALSGISNIRSKPGFCFAEGTPVATECGDVPIEQLCPGQRVLSSNDSEDADATQVNPTSWRVAHLALPDPVAAGAIIELSLLRPADWMAEREYEAGSRVPVSIPEIQLEGLAFVTRIEDCPPIPVGRGRVVLGTIRSTSDSVVSLTFAGEAQALLVTSGHPIFSESRADWVAAGDLQLNEQVRTRNGLASVRAKVWQPGLYRVHNIQVEASHTYYAGKLGVLAHNAYGKSPKRRGSFWPSTKEALGPLRSGQNRRHIVADEFTESITSKILNMAPDDAARARILSKIPDAQGVVGRFDPANFGGDIEAARRALQQEVFNNTKNLWIGDAAENQMKGRMINSTKGFTGENRIDMPPNQ